MRAFSLGDELRGRWHGSFSRYLADLRRHLGRMVGYGVAAALTTTAASAVTIAVLLGLVAAHRISLGAAGAAAFAVRLLADRVGTLLSSVGAFFEASLFLDELEVFLAQPLEVRVDTAQQLAPFAGCTPRACATCIPAPPTRR